MPVIMALMENRQPPQDARKRPSMGASPHSMIPPALTMKHKTPVPMTSEGMFVWSGGVERDSASNSSLLFP